MASQVAGGRKTPKQKCRGLREKLGSDRPGRSGERGMERELGSEKILKAGRGIRY